MQRISLSTSVGIALFWAAVVPAIAAEDLTKPTRQHEAMAHEVGTWDADVAIWMTPEAEPVKSKAVEKNEMFGKFWLMSQFESEFQGEKYMGRSATGYDPIKKKYTGGWIDTMSPFMMRMEGDYDEASKTMTMMGEGIEVMTGKSAKHKMVTKFDGNDKKTFEMFRQDGADGEWQRTMEIKYVRRK